MKITHVITAGLMIAGLGMTTAASAQDYRGDRYEHRGDRYDRHDHRYDRRGYGNRSYGYNTHRRCHTEYRHRRPVTVCYR